MPYLITIQYPYQHLEISLSNNTTVLANKIIPKIQAVAYLIPALQELLVSQNITLTDIACIGINTGPGPFNTLRSIIATANGISFAQKTPLVGCNGLDLIMQEDKALHQVAVMDAFGSDVYYAIKESGEQGYHSIENLMNLLNEKYVDQPLIFIGNGSIKYKDFIMQNFSGIAKINEDIIFASMQSLINETYTQYKSGKTSTEIFPLYFESPVVKS